MFFYAKFSSKPSQTIGRIGEISICEVSGGYGAQGLIMDISQAEKPLFKGSVGGGETMKQVGDLFDSKHQAGQASEQEEIHLEEKGAWHPNRDVN